MIKEAIAQGATIEEATEKARQALELEIGEQEEIKYDVLEIPTKKTLGLFGGRPAKVRAFIEMADAPEDPAEQAAAYLKKVLAQMGLSDVTIEIEHEESGANLRLDGEDIGFIIGHRGETLDALQYLASLVANHVEESYYRVTLDVGNYREKRKETLEALGKRMALRALKSGRNTSLEPMNPYERRIIHTAVQTVEGVKSWSVGEDLNRHVVIGPEGGERPQHRNDHRGSDRYGRRGDRGPRQNRGGASRVDSAPRAEGPKADDPTTPIYGKIEAKKQEN